MRDPELAPLLDVPWPTLDHRLAQARLARLGWTRCGQGDWAYALRSPSGRSVARISPFDPGYGYFVDLCERCAGNRYVPQIDIATPLEGGGHLAVLEYLHPPGDRRVVDGFLQRWEHPADADADLCALRREVDTIDAWGRANVRWWIGIDMGERHVLRSRDGNLKVIDLFGVGWGLLEELVENPRAFAERVPPDQCRHILDIPDLQIDHPADHLRRIRDALEYVKAGLQ